MEQGSTDPSDWNGTPLDPLSTIDSLLRCQVCKEYLQSAVITSCAHTFCSLCIRRCLTADGKCPVCRTTEQETRLRRNVLVQEICDKFVEARPKLLEVSHVLAEDTAKLSQNTRQSQRLGKRRRGDEDEAQAASNAPANPRRSLRNRNNQLSQASQDEDGAPQKPVNGSGYEPSDDNESLQSAHEQYTLKQQQQREEHHNDGLVPCPMCFKRMKEDQVFYHLDTCGSKDNEQDQNKDKTRTNGQKAQPSKTLSLQEAPNRLPSLTYGILKDRQLQSRIASLGIPATGSRDLLIRRHKEWLNLWNANCDSSHPKSKQELLRQLASWEKTLGGGAHNGTGFKSAKDSGKQIMDKDFNGQAWATNNRDSFDDLISRARASRSKGTPSTNASTMAETSDPKPENGRRLQQDKESVEIEVQGLLQALYRVDSTPVSSSSPATRNSPGEQSDTSPGHKRTKRLPESSQVYVGPLFDSGNPFLSRSPSTASPTTAEHDKSITPSNPLQRVVQEVEPGPVQMFRRSSLTIGSDSSRQNNKDMPRKVPMFEVPNQPIADADFAGFDGKQ